MLGVTGREIEVDNTIIGLNPAGDARAPNADTLAKPAGDSCDTGATMMVLSPVTAATLPVSRFVTTPPLGGGLAFQQRPSTFLSSRITSCQTP